MNRDFDGLITAAHAVMPPAVGLRGIFGTRRYRPGENAAHAAPRLKTTQGDVGHKAPDALPCPLNPMKRQA